MRQRFGGHLALCRPDGTEARTLVGKGGEDKLFRADMTDWTTPNGAVVDARRKLIVALDTTQGQAPDDARRTWYDDLPLDTRRQRVYVLARRPRELLAFDYEGKPLGRVRTGHLDYSIFILYAYPSEPGHAVRSSRTGGSRPGACPPRPERPRP